MRGSGKVLELLGGGRPCLEKDPKEARHRSEAAWGDRLDEVGGALVIALQGHSV